MSRTLGLQCLVEPLLGRPLVNTPARSAFRCFSQSRPTAQIPTSDLTIPLTIHSFPSLEPKAQEIWSANHLYLPLRRDILHSAVVYEGDNTRQGTASTKSRWEIHGSHRKKRPQKGSGQSRLGSSQSPMLRGGAKVFGPKPRDFGTDLPVKIYDKAWRIALSYRYRRGDLIVCEDGMDLTLRPDFWPLVESGTVHKSIVNGYLRKAAVQLLTSHRFGSETDQGRSLLITNAYREHLFAAVDQAGDYGRALTVDEVDVKDLLEDSRIIIERSALRRLMAEHQTDLVGRNVGITGTQMRALATTIIPVSPPQ